MQGCQTGQENVAANIEFQYFRERILLKLFRWHIMSLDFFDASVTSWRISVLWELTSSFSELRDADILITGINYIISA